MSLIADFGSFFAGGRPLTIQGEATRSISFTGNAKLEYDPNGLYHIEQAYVQYFIPAERRSALPLVLLHGGGMSGVMWEQTPDGRQGWAQRFLRTGVAVNIVDNVERGRASWVPFESVWPDRPILRSTEEAWSLFRIGSASDFGSRTPFAGQRFPVDCLDRLAMAAVPRWLSTTPAAVDAFAAVLDRVGPCAVVAHSQGADVALQAARARPHAVKAMVLVEPSGFLPAAQCPDLRDTSFLFVYGDNLDATPLWCRLMDQAKAFRAGLAAAGARTDWWELPSEGIRGNSHMLMMDDNSDAIADRVAAWLLTAF